MTELQRRIYAFNLVHPDWTAKRIAKALGCSKTTVDYWRRQWRGKAYWRPIPADRCQKCTRIPDERHPLIDGVCLSCHLWKLGTACPVTLREEYDTATLVEMVRCRPS